MLKRTIQILTKYRSYSILILYIAIAFFLYLPTLDFGYVLDDKIIITDNRFVQKGFEGITDIFSNESFTGFFGQQKDLVQGARYRPLSIATFAMEQGLWGSHPGISHGINICLYALLAFLIFRFIKVLYSRDNPNASWLLAGLTSIIYLVHPLHTEAVANIKGRDEIMVCMFLLLAFLSIIKWHKSLRWRYGLLGGLLFFAALLTKENAITFLLLIPLTLYIFFQSSISNAFRKSIPLLFASGAYLFVRFKVIGYLWSSSSEITDIMNNPFFGMSGAEKYATISFTLWKYLQLSIFPHPLTHDYYPYAIPILNWGDPRAYLSALFYLILGIFSVWIILKKEKAGYGLLFFLIPLSIVSNIVVNIGTFMNERFVFISSLGICLLMAIGVLYISRIKGIMGKTMAALLVLIILISYTYKTIDRVPDWENALTLNRSAIQSNPGSARANSFMSTALYNEWRPQNPSEEKRKAMEEAMFYVENATSMIPNYKNAQLMKAGIAAELYKFDNNTDLLLTHFNEVATYRPDIDFIFQFVNYVRGQVSDKVLVNFYYDTGYKTLFLNKKNPGWAIRYLLKGLEISSTDRKIIQGLAEVYEAVGDTKNAEKYFNILSQ
jgi:hypothetical protein